MYTKYMIIRGFNENPEGWVQESGHRSKLWGINQKYVLYVGCWTAELLYMYYVNGFHPLISITTWLNYVTVKFKWLIIITLM